MKRKYVIKSVALACAGLYFILSAASAACMPQVLAADLKKKTVVTAASESGTETAADFEGETATDSTEKADGIAVNPSGEQDLVNSGVWALDEANAPVVQAESAILMDAESGAILYAKNIHTERYPASITKILTCLIAREKSQLTDTVTFSTNAVYGIERGSSNIGIDEGETMTMEQCLYGILLASANEVAVAVAEHVAGSTSAFADLMNLKAKELGCTDSHFVNPNGLPNDAHYTSAYDMALIARAFFADETLARIAGTASYHIPATPTQPDEIQLMNHHRMLMGCLYGSKYSYPYTVGGKTGYTDVARQTLVTCAEKDGKKLICVVMKDEAPYHYEDTKSLFEYGFNHFNKLDAFSCLTREQIGTLICSNLGDVDYQLPAQADIMVPDGVDYSQLSTDIDTTASSLKGTIRFYYQDREAGNIPFTYTARQQLTQNTTEQTRESTDDTQAVGKESGSSGMIKWVIALVLCGICALLTLVTYMSHCKEKKRQQRRKEILQRSRKRRASIAEDTITQRSRRNTSAIEDLEDSGDYDAQYGDDTADHTDDMAYDEDDASADSEDVEYRFHEEDEDDEDF